MRLKIYCYSIFFLVFNLSAQIDSEVIIKQRVDFLLKRKSLPKTIGLTKLYFPLIETYLKEYNLPDNLKYLTIIESNMFSGAKSKSGAKGLWQFMESTGKEYGLIENHNINLFNEPRISTVAACKYLVYLYSELKDWELVLTAYNCGIGRVKKIIRKTGKNNFWEIYPFLPKETQAYVPSFYAINFIFKNLSAISICSSKL